jgi:SAM-dependent methyltransferase
VTEAGRYETLSSARVVNMGDEWFDVAHVDHFWIKRRLDVLIALCGPLLRDSARLAEIGCGSGLVQSQFEDRLGLSVDGFDLNAEALERNASRTGRLACYDVQERNEDLRDRYDLVLLLDVIEHVQEDVQFLEDSAFLAKSGGHLIVNVPASPRLYSRYDVAAGHLRRYTPRALLEAGQKAGLEAASWTYWGFPLLPLAVARKFLMLSVDDEQVIRAGFEPPGRLANRLLNALARLESIPQKLFGTSLLVLFRKSAR